jgi:hypothetical protein
MLNQPDPRMTAHAPSRETASPGVVDAIVRPATTGEAYGASQQTYDVNQAGYQGGFLVEVDQKNHLDRAKSHSWVVNVTSFLSGMLEMILALRFGFRLLGASQETGFLLFLYRFSQVFVAPFHSIFYDQALGTRSVFELSTLAAMLVYALLAWGLVALSHMVFAPNNSDRQRFTITRSR